MVEMISALIRAVAVFAIVMGIMPLLIWMERKGAAYIQDRRGPNRASILGFRLWGLMHVVADVIKLLTKQEITVEGANRPLVYIAPMFAFFSAVAAAAVIPFSGQVMIFGQQYSLQVAQIGSGLVLALAISSLGAYALLMAGIGSRSAYPRLGAMRAASQFISYELAIGMAAVAIFIVAGSLDIARIADDQGATLWRWNFIRQPLAFIIYITALFAESNRLPFDLPEGDSELVAGFHVEYSSMRFAMFYMAEYAHIIVGSAIAAAIFFGGWHIPFATQAVISGSAGHIAAIAWPLIAVAAMVGGAKLAGGMRRRFRDIRDYEPVMLGSIMMLSGLALAVAYPAFIADLLNQPWLAQATLFTVGFLSMLAKTVLISAGFIWVRWTLPRFRYDQLMGLGWKVLLPLSMINVMVTACVVVYSGAWGLSF